jgi:hypothetical protein
LRNALTASRPRYSDVGLKIDGVVTIVVVGVVVVVVGGVAVVVEGVAVVSGGGPSLPSVLRISSVYRF